LAAGNPVPIYRGTNLVETPKNHMETFCSEALSFIDRHAQQPFFLYLPFTAVHGPMVGPEPWLSQVDDRIPANRRKYAADLTQMDDVIGRVMAKLRERGLEENSLVFFFSDNGGAGGATSNGVLRGTKWTLWDGGIHVPFIAQWKGRIPAGKVLDAPVIQVDLLPTAIAAAGGEIKPEWKLDGVNLLPYLEGKTTQPPHEALYWRFGIQYAVRQGDWKLVKPSINDTPHLFNLIKDPGENNDLAASEPERAKKLQALWDAWNKNNEEPRWIDIRWNSLDEMKKRAKGAGKKGKAK
jgi:arylsulfatase A-like enzyme